MGPHEPYWRTNTSFSPPPPQWNFRFHSEPPSFHSHESNHLYTPSTSSNSRESRNWFRPNSNYLPNHRHSDSDGIGIGIPFFSTPSDLSPAQQWTPPTIQEINLHDYSNPSEGILSLNEERPSMSSNSDSSDFDQMSKSLSSRHNFTGRGCFMSKPVYPIPVESNSGIHDSDASCDFEMSDVSEQMELDWNRTSGDNYKCGLCERFLSQRSPWGPRQIIRSGDFPVTGVLSCRHVFHAECLDQNTPKINKGDPSCPVCVKSENKNSPEKRVMSKLKNGTSCNAMLVINQNRIKKGVLLKGNSGKEFAGKFKGSPQWSGGGGGGDGVGSSKGVVSLRKKS